MTLVGRKAPDFTASAVLASGEIVNQWQFFAETSEHYKILVFYPLDFTFVCPSELIALHNRKEAFAKRNAEVVTVSVDSQFTHAAWRNTPINKGGIGEVSFTMVSDLGHEIARMYGVESVEKKVAFRGTFVMDQQGVVQAQLVNNLPIGRNIDEIIRLLDAVRFHEAHGEVCPAGWMDGDQGMVANAGGVATYLNEHAKTL